MTREEDWKLLQIALLLICSKLKKENAKDALTLSKVVELVIFQLSAMNVNKGSSFFQLVSVPKTHVKCT